MLKTRRQRVYKFVRVRKSFSVYDYGYHQPAVNVAHDHVSDKSESGCVVIHGYGVFRDKIFYDRYYSVAPFGLNRAARNRNNSVAVLREKADNAPEIIFSYGKLQFVSVTVFEFASYGERNVIVDERNLRKTVFYYSAFKFQLKFILQMLQLTAAAFFVYGAFGADAFFRRSADFYYFPESHVLFDFQHLVSDFFLRQGVGNENRTVLRSHYAFSVGA